MTTPESRALKDEVISKLKASFSNIKRVTSTYYEIIDNKIYLRVATKKAGAKYWFDVNPKSFKKGGADFLLYACGSKDRLYLFPVNDFIELISGASIGGVNQFPNFTIYLDNHKLEPAGQAHRRHDISKYYNNFSPIRLKDNQIEIVIPSEDDYLQSDLSQLTLEEKRQIQYHRRIERNPRLAEAAKQIHGYTCQVCEFNYAKIYGKLGHKYIEAHHLTPLSELPMTQSIKLSAKDDFAVLCSNCHNMIHRENPIPSVADLRKIVQEMKRKDIQYA
jgi:predicted restriction endonuclease